MNGSFRSFNDSSLRTSERSGGLYVSITFAILSVFSIYFNSLVAYCLFVNRKKAWTRKAKQLFYLVLSDLFAGTILIPRTILATLDRSLRTYNVCAVTSYIVISSQVISVNHVLSLCIHRYIQIRKAHLPSQIDTYRYGLESGVIWIASLLLSATPYIFWGRHEEVFTRCTLMAIFGESNRPAIVYKLVLFGLPWILTNTIYLATVQKVRSTGQVHPAPVLRADTVANEEQPCSSQIQPDSRLSSQISASLAGRRCDNFPQSVAPVVGSTTQDEPRHGENTTTLYCHHKGNTTDGAASLFLASDQQCDLQSTPTHLLGVSSGPNPLETPHTHEPKTLVQQNTSYQPNELATDPKTQEESHQPYNPRIKKAASRISKTPHQNNACKDATIMFPASNQCCIIVQQTKSNQSNAQESHQPYNPRGKTSASCISKVAQSGATVQGIASVIVTARNRRVVKAITILLLAFNISISPLIIIPCMILYGKGDAIPKQQQGLAMLNHVVNPIIYTFAFTQLRDEVKRTLQRPFSRLIV